MADVKVVNRPEDPVNVDIVGGGLTFPEELVSSIDGVEVLKVGVWHVVPVSATDLDIRALDSSTDSVSAVQSGTWTVSATDLDVRNLTASADSVKNVSQVLSNDGADDGDYILTLTANTATQIPESANVPDYDYVLVLGNRSDTAMIWGSKNGIANGSAIIKGIPLQSETGAVPIKLKANENIFVACSAAKDVNYTIMSVEEAT